MARDRRTGSPGTKLRLKEEIRFGLLRRRRLRHQEPVGIYRRAAYPDFIMKVGRRHPAGCADSANRFALPDFLSRNHVETRQVRIVGLVAVAMIHDDQASVPAGSIG